MKLNRYSDHKFTQFIYLYKLVGIGLRMYPTRFYQIFYCFLNLPAMCLTFKSKPKITNLYLLNIALFLPYLLYLLYKGLIVVVTELFWLLRYVLIDCYRHAVNDWGWSGRYLLIPILFWQIFTIILVVYLFSR